MPYRKRAYIALLCFLLFIAELVALASYRVPDRIWNWAYNEALGEAPLFVRDVGGFLSWMAPPFLAGWLAWKLFRFFVREPMY
jgi:hypothetical protein